MLAGELDSWRNPSGGPPATSPTHHLPQPVPGPLYGKEVGSTGITWRGERLSPPERARECYSWAGLRGGQRRTQQTQLGQGSCPARRAGLPPMRCRQLALQGTDYPQSSPQGPRDCERAGFLCADIHAGTYSGQGWAELAAARVHQSWQLEGPLRVHSRTAVTHQASARPGSVCAL